MLLQHSLSLDMLTQGRLSLERVAADSQLHVVWRGWLLAAGNVMQQPQPCRVLNGAMTADKATWPPGLEANWPQQLVCHHT